VSNDDVVLSADEIKRTMISYGGIARRISFGDDKGGIGQWYVRFLFLHDDACSHYTLLCGEYRCERVLCIEHTTRCRGLRN